MNNYIEHLETPIGTLEIRATDKGISWVVFNDQPQTADNTSANAITEMAKQQLQEYFSGNRETFSVPLDTTGTQFQHSVWKTLCEIEYGQVVAYQDIAVRLNNPKAVRAVGAANGKNPVSIIVPCHRIIGSNGKLTGYAGGLERKAWLLRHEKGE